jgi:hypothetical protein
MELVLFCRSRKLAGYAFFPVTFVEDLRAMRTGIVTTRARSIAMPLVALSFGPPVPRLDTVRSR